jgi:hypothetical protein
MKFKDRTGQRYGKLVVISRAENRITGKQTCVFWNCRCDCGNDTVTRGTTLTAGQTSCGRCPNRIELFGSTAIVWLDNTAPPTACMIDAADIPLVQNYHWCLSSQGGYRLVMTNVWVGRKRSTKRIHQLIAGRGADHINRDTLDNRRENLRLAVQAENTRNRSKQESAKQSRYKGVRPARNGANYQARITFEGKSIFLGTFKTETEAAQAYNDAAKMYHGQFAALNEVGLVPPGGIEPPYQP